MNRVRLGALVPQQRRFHLDPQSTLTNMRRKLVSKAQWHLVLFPSLPSDNASYGNGFDLFSNYLPRASSIVFINSTGGFTSSGSNSLSLLKLFLSPLALTRQSPPTSFTTSSSKFMTERTRLTRDWEPAEKSLPPWASGRHVCSFLGTKQAACTLKIQHSSYNSGTSVRFIDWLGRQTRRRASAPNHFKLRKVTCNFISARESLETFKDGERKLSMCLWRPY